ncbi:hypothetical protein EVAR_103511_1 [Eumeta japonica]|uniref:Uncharacterized protein n=1 Tax=Eumeta variegata TaxID=151549 RepID=A0A4C1YS47_EUMVA|nr:hypothetical protein EVAR_103511_1 [Eumeta japonica]
MSHQPLTQSEILKDILQEDEESDSELSDQCSETSDHIVSKRIQSAEEFDGSDSDEKNLPLKYNFMMLLHEHLVASCASKKALPYSAGHDVATIPVDYAATDVVKTLITSIRAAGRDPTMDSGTVCLTLVVGLAKNYKISVVDIMR